MAALEKCQSVDKALIMIGRSPPSAVDRRPSPRPTQKPHWLRRRAADDLAKLAKKPFEMKTKPKFAGIANANERYDRWCAKTP